MLKESGLRKTLCATLCAAALAAPAGAAAQSGGDDWKFLLSVYGWIPSIDGKTNFPTGSGNLGVDSSTIIDSLQFAAMGTFHARKGRWGLLTDLVYADLGDSKTGARSYRLGAIGIPADAILTADESLKMWLWTLAGTYAVVQKPDYEMNLLAGVRYLNVQNDLSWAFGGNVGPIPLPGRAGVSSADDTVWDGIVGVQGTARLGSGGWYMPYYVDVGTGNSQFSWQALVGIGYEFKWGSAVAAYRYLDYNLSSGKALEDLSVYGPMIGVTFRF